jgi:hypothetical protein
MGPWCGACGSGLVDSRHTRQWVVPGGWWTLISVGNSYKLALELGWGVSPGATPRHGRTVEARASLLTTIWELRADSPALSSLTNGLKGCQLPQCALVSMS